MIAPNFLQLMRRHTYGSASELDDPNTLLRFTLALFFFWICNTSASRCTSTERASVHLCELISWPGKLDIDDGYIP